MAVVFGYAVTVPIKGSGMVSYAQDDIILVCFLVIYDYLEQGVIRGHGREKTIFILLLLFQNNLFLY